MPSLRVGIVSSVGGHLQEVLELVPALYQHELFLVLNDEAPWRGQLPVARTYRITHAERDLRLFVNFGEAAKILARERPDVLISAGASPAVPFFLLGKLLGKKTVFVESFAAVKTPTLTGRLLYPLADHFFVQWPELLQTFPKARYLGPVCSLKPSEPLPRRAAHAPAVFVTVGSSDRLCRRLLGFVDKLCETGAISGEVLVQNRAPGFTSRHFQQVPYLPADKLDELVQTAAVVICHGGAGVLLSCLKHGRHPLVVPRVKAHGEAVNDHQQMLCEALASRGLITSCSSFEELFAAYSLASERAASPRIGLKSELGSTLTQLLSDLSAQREKRTRK